MYLPKKVENNVLRKLKTIISAENPDLICLVEIEKNKQIKNLISDKYPFYDIDIKYGEDSILRKLPVFKVKGNAFISKQKLAFKKHYLKNGTKKLLYEIKLPNKISVILMHFSLEKNVRAKQFQEIWKMFANVKSKIICGDFNIFGGLSELDDFMKKADLKLAHENPTFPAFKPKRPLDLFLCSKNLKTKTKVLKTQLSDHLPVILELQ